jgi:hypothetical protein
MARSAMALHDRFNSRRAIRPRCIHRLPLLSVIEATVAAAQSWTDAGGFWIALGAFVLAGAGFLVSVSSARSGRRSADAAVDAAADSRRSADASEVAARAAEKSADADQRLALLEAAARHDELAPRFKGRWHLEKSNPDNGTRHLTYRFQLDRDYTFEGIAWTMNRTSRTTVTVTRPTAPGGDWKASVELWSRDRKESAWWELELRFWPPRPEQGRAAPWSCRCDGPGVDDGAPHWDLVIRIDPPT